MTTKTAARKQVKDYRQKLIADLKKKYECTSCGYTLSGELQLWFQSKTCISLTVDEPVAENYDNVLESTSKTVEFELDKLGLRKSSKTEKRVPE